MKNNRFIGLSLLVEKYLGKKQQPEKWLEYPSLMTPEERRQQALDEQNDEKPKRGIPINIPALSDLVNQPKPKRKRGISYSNDGWYETSWFKTFLIYVLAGIIIVGLFFVVRGISNYFNEKKPLEGTISELHYKRDKYIMQYAVKSGGAWWNEIPSMAYDSHYDSRKIRSYHTESYISTCIRTVTKTDSKGHMSSRSEMYACTKTREVPDYDNWWAYSYNGWERVKVISSEERLAKPEYQLIAQWPKPDGLVRELGTAACGATPSVDPAKQKDDPALGCQAIAADVGQWYYASYIFKVDNESRVMECSIDYDVWQNLRVSMAMYGSYYAHNKGVDCNDLHIGHRPTATPEGN